jgi:PleD family two-component response regulator
MKKKILIIDNDEVHLNEIVSILKNDFDIEIAKSSNDALKSFSKGFTPDAIFIDIFMAEMGGWDTFKQLKGITLLYDIPIVFFSIEHYEHNKIQAH